MLKLGETMKATLLPPKNPALCSPITSNRELGSCLIANIPMRDLLSTELTRAGFELVAPTVACERTIRIPIDTWIEIGALMILARNPEPARLSDSYGNILAWKGHTDPAHCAGNIVTDADCFPVVYPWDLLRMNEEVLAMMDENSLQGEISPLATLSGIVRVAKGARILPGTVIEGPVLIGANSQIGPNAYIRGATSIGANCFVGNGAEVKNSIIYNNTYISRQCYVGDSIIGTHVTLGAGTCTENHRHDGRHHVSTVLGKTVNTGRLKLGTMIGDGVKTGVNTSIEAGVKIGLARTTKPGSYITQDLM
jgi:UDP-N-acetylglucosamine diphosphorylase / glucose-1-phosphate thymidylyltransferase / UDP-N-acetylgalactosamine diphosphorylase / glucosamine-1-phosphate N-acetyltransferase / galactosamine-1-phosphate N-acetyltransferase